MTFSRKSLFVLAATFAFAPAAGAAVDTANVIVTATVANGCSIDNGALDFGLYNTQDPVAHDAIGDVTVQCNAGTPATITLGQGANATGASTDAVPDRQMAGLIGGLLKYSLFTDLGRTDIWGNTALTGYIHPAANGGLAVALVIYGTIPALQGGVGTSYTDTVIATITF